jgi:hypothetical protein
VNVELSRTEGALYAAAGGRVGAAVTILPRLHLLGAVDLVGIATPTVVQIDRPRTTASVVRSGPVDASAGIALSAAIF